MESFSPAVPVGVALVLERTDSVHQVCVDVRVGDALPEPQDVERIEQLMDTYHSG